MEKKINKITFGYDFNWKYNNESPEVYCYTPEGVFIGKIWHLFNPVGGGPNPDDLKRLTSIPYVAQLKGHYLFVELVSYCGSDRMLEYDMQEVAEQMLYYYAKNYLSTKKYYDYYRKTSIDNPYVPYQKSNKNRDE